MIEGFVEVVVERFGKSELLDILVARIDEKLERTVKTKSRNQKSLSHIRDWLTISLIASDCPISDFDIQRCHSV